MLLKLTRWAFKKNGGKKCSPTLHDKHLWCQAGKHTVYPTQSKMKFAVLPYHGVQIVHVSHEYYFWAKHFDTQLWFKNSRSLLYLFWGLIICRFRVMQPTKEKFSFTDVTQLPLLHHPPVFLHTQPHTHKDHHSPTSASLPTQQALLHGQPGPRAFPGCQVEG